MVILSDIVPDFEGTSADIFIDALAHYLDLDADSVLPLLVYLKSDAAVTPGVILLDHSSQKKDSLSLTLRSYYLKITGNMHFAVNPGNLFLSSSMDACVLNAYTGAGVDNLRISCNADFITSSHLIPSEHEMLALKTSIFQNMGTEIRIHPMSCKLAKLNDKYIHETDPFLLSELDWYEVGARLTSEVAIQKQIPIDTSEQISHLQAAATDMYASPRVSYYDEYLLMDLDVYTLEELDRKIYRNSD